MVTGQWWKSSGQRSDRSVCYLYADICHDVLFQPARWTLFDQQTELWKFSNVSELICISHEYDIKHFSWNLLCHCRTLSTELVWCQMCSQEGSTCWLGNDVLVSSARTINSSIVNETQFGVQFSNNGRRLQSNVYVTRRNLRKKQGVQWMRRYQATLSDNLNNF